MIRDTSSGAVASPSLGVEGRHERLPCLARVLLVVPTHNRTEELGALLSSLALLDTTNLKLAIAVVDDGSTLPVDGSLRTLDRFETCVFRNSEPRGPSYCRNQAARRMDSDYIWFLDSDTEIRSPGTLRRMIAILDQDPQIAGVGGEVAYIDHALHVITSFHLSNGCLISRNRLVKEYRAEFVDLIAACNLLLRREAFERVGGFDEALPRYEDSDLCLRLRKRGYRFYQDPDTVVWHKVSPNGRQSGVFALQYTNPSAFISDWLASRILILANSAPWTIPFLPIVDLVVLPMVLLKLRAGVYSPNRLELVIPRWSPRFAARFLLKAAYFYLWGLYVFACRVVGQPTPSRRGTRLPK